MQEDDDSDSRGSPIILHRTLSMDGETLVKAPLGLPTAEDLNTFAEFEDDGERPLTIEELKQSFL